VPSYRPPGLPIQATVNAAIANANKAISAALSTTNGYIDQANTEVTTAYGVHRLTPYVLLAVLLLGSGLGVGLGLSEAPTHQVTEPAQAHARPPAGTSVPTLAPPGLAGSAVIPVAYRIGMPDVIGMQRGLRAST
jgi:hypothetical protein